MATVSVNSATRTGESPGRVVAMFCAGTYVYVATTNTVGASHTDRASENAQRLCLVPGSVTICDMVPIRRWRLCAVLLSTGDVVFIGYNRDQLHYMKSAAAVPVAPVQTSALAAAEGTPLPRAMAITTAGDTLALASRHTAGNFTPCHPVHGLHAPCSFVHRYRVAVVSDRVYCETQGCGVDRVFIGVDSDSGVGIFT